MPNNNAQVLLTVNTDTVIGSGTTYLESVSYNGFLNSNNVSLSSFLYISKTIEFKSFPNSNSVIFNFAGLPVPHEKIIARVRVFTQCSAVNFQNTNVELVLSGAVPVSVNKNLSPNTDTIIEAEVVHALSTLSLTIAFGTPSQSCSKLVQDITLYWKKCK